MCARARYGASWNGALDGLWIRAVGAEGGHVCEGTVRRFIEQRFQ
jgi:hypothetical protein